MSLYMQLVSRKIILFYYFMNENIEVLGLRILC